MNKIDNKKYIIATLALICIAVIGVSLQRPASDESVTLNQPARTGGQDSPKPFQHSVTGKSDSQLTQGSEPPEIGPIEPPEGCESATLIFTSLPAKCLVDGKLVSVQPDIPAVIQDGQKYYIVPGDSGK